MRALVLILVGRKQQAASCLTEFESSPLALISSPGGLAPRLFVGVGGWREPKSWIVEPAVSHFDAEGERQRVSEWHHGLHVHHRLVG